MARRPALSSRKRTSLADAAAKRVESRAPASSDDSINSVKDSPSIGKESRKVQEDDSDSDDSRGGISDDVEVEAPGILPATRAKSSITKTQYMSVHVRNTTTSKVFRAVKFLTPAIIDTTMTRLARSYDIEPSQFHTWKSLYQKEMIYAINNKRNSVYQSVKPKMKSK